MLSYLKEPELVATIQTYFGVITNPEQQGNTKSKEQNYAVTNKFWYYLFVFGTALGDEAFYSGFIPFWFWNIDGAVGRRVVLIWTIVMYIGQAVKDILRWPRPGPPVVRLQSKWSLEYGMPSTHAMVAVAFPFSFLLCTVNRYQYNIPLGLAIAILWCSVICLSRLYLGMHSVLDIIVGIALAVMIMTPLMPIIDYVDNYLLTDATSPFLLLVTSILMIVYYPNSGKWTPTRGDTTMILSVCVGIHIGAWLNYHLGIMMSSELTPPYAIMWPSYTMLGCTILRTFIGFALVLLTKAISKSATYSFICALLREDADVLKKSVNSLSNKHKTIVDLCCKYVSCGMIGFNALYLIPQLFRFSIYFYLISILDLPVCLIRLESRNLSTAKVNFLMLVERDCYSLCVRFNCPVCRSDLISETEITCFFNFRGKYFVIHDCIYDNCSEILCTFF